VLYPFLPVWWIGTSAREDCILTFHIEDYFEDIRINNKYLLGREKERVLKIFNTFYGKYER